MPRSTRLRWRRQLALLPPITGGSICTSPVSVSAENALRTRGLHGLQPSFMRVSGLDAAVWTISRQSSEKWPRARPSRVRKPLPAFDRMMSGEATPSQMGALLMGLRVRGGTVDEITGAVSAMRAKMLRVDAPADAVDVVGTGGDGSGSVNVSTCASFIVAGSGVIVAKHGNQALSLNQARRTCWRRLA